MRISHQTWLNYIEKLDAIDSKAADMMQEWVEANGLEDRQALVEYAYALTTKYGEAAAALACEMYDATALASGVTLPAAVPAETPTIEEVGRAVNGSLRHSQVQVPSTVYRLTKQSAADTTLQNAARDGAQFAWIPYGDTCPFCITLASRGWQYMSKKALKGGHAEHIHANCDCQYGVRFSEKDSVAGYDPKVYEDMYYGAEGSTPQERINSMRRVQYQQNRDHINEMKRAAYARRRGIEVAEGERLSLSNRNIVNMNVLDAPGYVEKFQNITGNEEVDNKIYEYAKKILEHRNGTDYEDLYLIDGITGSPIYQLSTSDVPHGVRYNEEIETAILQAHNDKKEIIAIHNHPNGLPPTMDDGVSAYDHGYSKGVVIGHNLEVFTYTPTDASYTKEECQETHDAINGVLQFLVEPDDDIWYSTLRNYGMEVIRK
ncbi:MAG: hypothetical protein J6I66_01860 [Lachnospiraceae bacterium]|nr:hypothetical protein [Lachnospiraceae bacterium]